MVDIKANLEEVRSKMKDGVTLVAVTKTHSPQEINIAIDNGVTDIGENKVQEILEKYDKVKPVRWHMIGHLQTNKVKYIIDKVVLIHSVESLKLAKEIDKRAKQHDKVMDILIEINVSGEESKWGVPKDELVPLIDGILAECPNVRIKGLMTVVPYADAEEIRGYFAEAKALYDELAKRPEEMIDFEYLSMGMTHDYETAMEEGANIIRVGTGIFGTRIY